MPDIYDGGVFKARALQREITNELITAMLTGLPARVRSVVRQTLDRSGSLFYVATSLLDGARVEIEDMWYRGDLSMIDERRMLGQLEEAISQVAGEVPPSRQRHRRCIMIATDPVAAAINRALLEEDGWIVTYLPMDTVVAQAQRLQPSERRLVVVVGGAAAARPELRSIVVDLKAMGSRVLVFVSDQWAQAGGWQRLRADAWAGNTQTLLLLARKLVSSDSTFSISEVAASLRVTPHAIRAWERRYRLPAPDRDSGGQRRFTTEDLQLLLRISHAATVHRHSLKLAAMEAQGLLGDDLADDTSPSPISAVQARAPDGEHWLRVADAIPEMLMLVDSEGLIIDCNVATARARDTVRENLRGTRLTDLIIEYDRAKAVRLYRPSPRQRDGWELRMRSPNEKCSVIAFDSRVVAGKHATILGLIGRTVLTEPAA